MSDHLATITPLVGIIARERTTVAGRPDLYDDARQEGLIAAWKASQGRENVPREYMVAAARNGVGALLRGRQPTGAETHRGVARTDAADIADSLQRMAGDGEVYEVNVPSTEAAEALSRVEASYHASEVREAVSGLPEADASITRLRSAGHSWPEVARGTDRGSEATRRRFINHIAPRLRAELAYLNAA